MHHAKTNVKTIGKIFVTLIYKTSHLSSILHKILNSNTVEISESYTKNMRKIIKKSTIEK